jgi:dATP pyrophosphohydrolase
VKNVNAKRAHGDTRGLEKQSSAIGHPGSPKIPQSVLVVIYTAELEVLLIKRADAADFWQSVTGSKDSLDESFAQTAVREVREETGIDCRPGSSLASGLRDWQLENVYDIYPAWQHRYETGVTRNTEHLFGLMVPAAMAVRLSPSEHTDYRWLPYREAADACFSPSNAEACLMLPRFAVKNDLK